MQDITPMENWQNTLAFSHSGSERTKELYTFYMNNFLEYAQTTAEEILKNYSQCKNDKEFIQKYTPLIMSFANSLKKQNYSSYTIRNTISAIKSFFKYNNLPLGYSPSGRAYIRFHNRDITKEEIELIIKESQPRERAYYAVMIQSGLRPYTNSKLKIGDLEKILDENTPVPCLIKVRQEITKGKYSEYFTFIGPEAILYIKDYLKRQRPQNLTEDDYLFTMENKSEPVSEDTINHTFANKIKKLKKEHTIDFKTETQLVNNKSVNRNKLKLYNLRKYFRNHAGNAGLDFVNFWMGHSLGVDGHYFSQTDVEQHRKQYKEKAMPNLRIQTKTPDQNEQMINEIETKIKEQYQKEIEKLKKQHEKEMREMKSQIEELKQYFTNLVLENFTPRKE